jgi:anti-anti-sigma regulatory factor
MLINSTTPKLEHKLNVREEAYSQVQTERNRIMNISITQKQGRVPVTILQLIGKLDGSNYMQLIDEARNVYLKGLRDLLIDLSGLTYMSSAGIAAIHKTALIFRGQPMAEDESGWAAYHAIDRDRGNGVQSHVKLLCPEAEVENILDISGFKSLFEIYTDLETAVASF